MLIDNVTIKVNAGHGGDGAAAFSKIKMALGPTGGSGGHGGDVYLEAASDIGALRKFRTKKVFSAENGADGRLSFRDGRQGNDLILAVPRGTVIRNFTKDEEYEFIKAGEKIRVARGGKGGKGNFLFKSSRNTSPRQFERGMPGESATLQLELKLIADIGFVGLPNVGKSSFLNVITNAQSKVANYPFTTLEPNLGAYFDLILADIPGLIEGASYGKGLGIRFLRHIERTPILFHFIDAGSKDPAGDYNVIRKELRAYNPELLLKPEYIVISKIDTVDSGRIKEIQKLFLSLDKEIFPISILDEESLGEVKKLLGRIMEGLMIAQIANGK